MPVVVSMKCCLSHSINSPLTQIFHCGEPSFRNCDSSCKANLNGFAGTQRSCVAGDIAKGDVGTQRFVSSCVVFPFKGTDNL